jgi:hypothetical protein
MQTAFREPAPSFAAGKLSCGPLAGELARDRYAQGAELGFIRLAQEAIPFRMNLSGVVAMRPFKISHRRMGGIHRSFEPARVWYVHRSQFSFKRAQIAAD